MTINREMSEKWYIFSMEKKKKPSYICNNMNESEKYYVKPKKPE